MSVDPLPVPLTTVEPHYTLGQAAAKFFPHGPLTAASLRNEIKKGRLQATMPAGKLLVTETAIAEMLALCRVKNRPACTSKSKNSHAPTLGTSVTERNASALAAAKLIFRERKQHCATTSNSKFQAPQGLGAELLVVEAVASYLKEYAAYSPSRDFLLGTARPILEWWSRKKIRDVNGVNCRAYVAWRTKQTYRSKPISDQTARHDLKTMRAAINWYKSERDPTLVAPAVTLPPKAAPRFGYYLERFEVAARLRLARKRHRTRHVARLILIGVYTGSRPGAILRMRWAPTVDGGWFDLEGEVMYRAGSKARPTKKRQPPAQIHSRLLPHLRRWRAADGRQGITHVIHYNGDPVTKLRHSWKSVAKLAGSREDDGPHILRHTAATWLMRSGVDIFEAAGIPWDVTGSALGSVRTPPSKIPTCSSVGNWKTEQGRRQVSNSALQPALRCSNRNVNLLKLLVGAEGFEPPAPCSQSRCSTRLSYAPTLVRSMTTFVCSPCSFTCFSESPACCRRLMLCSDASHGLF